MPLPLSYHPISGRHSLIKDAAVSSGAVLTPTRLTEDRS